MVGERGVSIETDEVRQKAETVHARLDSRERDYLKGQLEDIAEEFPEVVEDARRLWAALQQDEIEFVLDEDDSPEPPVFALLSLHSPEDDAVPVFPRDMKIFKALKNTPNSSLYSKMSEKYGDWVNRPDEEGFNATEILFSRAVSVVVELSAWEREHTSDPQTSTS